MPAEPDPVLERIADPRVHMHRRNHIHNNAARKHHFLDIRKSFSINNLRH
jgi:hypothetical protein